MRSANLSGAKLQRTHFTHADLSQATLMGATILRTGYDQTILDSTEVGKIDWLESLPLLGQDSIRGLQYLISTYGVDTVHKHSRIQYLLLRKTRK